MLGNTSKRHQEQLEKTGLTLYSKEAGRSQKHEAITIEDMSTK